MPGIYILLMYVHYSPIISVKTYIELNLFFGGNCITLLSALIYKQRQKYCIRRKTANRDSLALVHTPTTFINKVLLLHTGLSLFFFLFFRRRLPDILFDDHEKKTTAMNI